MGVSTEDWDSIQAAIDMADPGEEVRVVPGTYEENPVVVKNLTLRGEDSKSVKITGGLIIASLNEVTVTVAEVTIGGGVLPVGVSITGNVSAKVIDCEISTNEQYGVCLFGSSMAEVVDCQITDNGSEGVIARNQSQARIKNSEICNNESCGINFCDFSKLTLVDNVVSDNQTHGIKGECFSSADVSNCQVENNGSYGFRYAQNPYGSCEEPPTARISGESNRVLDNSSGKTSPRNLSFICEG